MDIIQRLFHYHHRQVIVNYYLKEELLSKEGYHFDRIHYVEPCLLIIKDDKHLFSIDTNTYCNISYPGMFANHFTFENNHERIDIYFPLFKKMPFATIQR
ncbi:hypothetical protein D3C86_1884070 [compost metagenome]